MLLLSTAYAAPVQYYAYLYHAERLWEERHEHYVKQTYRNRCYIATPAGPQPLTLPVERSGASHGSIADLRLSDHGNWQHLHWAALVSAYEGSPFFEYYADDFRPLYERKYKFLVDFNAALRDTVLEALDLRRDIRPTSHYIADVAAELPGAIDLRQAISPKQPQPDPRFTARPYYQVFAPRTGFLPNLSILDLLFNMGPEGRLVLRGALAVEN